MASSLTPFLGGGIGQPGAPGHISSFASGAANAAAGLSTQAMENRYTQLGLGSQGATPTSPGGGAGESTAALMDVGAIPSLTGGIPGQFQALLGQIQNNALQNPGSAGKSNSPATAISGAGQIARLVGK